jgi:hypothetical protein
MPNVKLLFCGTEQSETQEHQLQCYSNTNNEIYIGIDGDVNNDYFKGFLCLDKSTAIKLHRELKKQISFLND